MGIRVYWGALLLASLLISSPAMAGKKGKRATNLDPSAAGPVSGTGIEGQDVVAIADRMMRDMLSNPSLSARATPPQIIIDGEYFTNESSQRINKNILTDRLRVALNRASQGRFVFVSRQAAKMVQDERDLKREGVTDVGTLGLTRGQAGGDFRLQGNITSLDSRNNDTGMVQRFTQLTFEMVDLERATIVWSNSYDIARAAADDVVYR
jgi:hypothetical protein